MGFENVLRDFNSLYREFLNKKQNFGKGEKGQKYLEILKYLFLKYGRFLGYLDLSSFRRDFVDFKKNIKKNKNDIYTENDIKEIFSEINKESYPKEGDGEIFTISQIENFGLNPDSYY